MFSAQEFYETQCSRQAFGYIAVYWIHEAFIEFYTLA